MVLNEFSFSVEVISFGCCAGLGVASVCLLISLLLFPSASPVAAGYSGPTWQQYVSLSRTALLQGLLAVLCTPCSISTLREGKLHRFVLDFFGFLDLLPFRGACFFFSGWDLWTTCWINCTLSSQIARGNQTTGPAVCGWASDVVEGIGFLLILAGAVLWALYLHDRFRSPDGARQPLEEEAPREEPAGGGLSNTSTTSSISSSGVRQGHADRGGGESRNAGGEG